MLTPKDIETLKELLLNTTINRGRDWLVKVHINDGDKVGWPHLPSQGYPSVWGGTLDGIRGLTAAGVSSRKSIIEHSLSWLLKQQRPDGGFGTRELRYSAVEATAWVLIVLRTLGFDLNENDVAKNALKYLEKCIGPAGEVATSPDDMDNIRTLPTVLTLWAISEYSSKAQQVGMFLKHTQDNQTGGWGAKPGEQPAICLSAQVLLTLLSTGFLKKQDSAVKKASQFLLKNQKSDGSWENCRETWFSHKQPDVPNQHTEFTTPFAMLALLEAGHTTTSKPILKAVRWLQEGQNEDGSWCAYPHDTERHIWCTADNIVGLSVAREKFIEELAISDFSILI